MKKKPIRNLTVEQIAKRLNYSAQWIRLLARQERIPATKIGFGRGRSWRFNEEEVRKFLYIENNL